MVEPLYVCSKLLYTSASTQDKIIGPAHGGSAHGRRPPAPGLQPCASSPNVSTRAARPLSRLSSTVNLVTARRRAIHCALAPRKKQIFPLPKICFLRGVHALKTLKELKTYRVILVYSSLLYIRMEIYSSTVNYRSLSFNLF